MEIGLLGAFFGGLLSLFSPCSALLLPSFFAYAFDRVGTLARRTVFFYTGLLLVLVPLGAGVAFIGSLITRYRDTVTMVGGAVLIVLGLFMITGRGFGIGAATQASSRIRVSSNASVFLLGTVYALAGFCSGPLLGSVLTVSAAGGEPVYGGTLMVLYALGMAAPLFVLALFWDRFDLGRKPWLRGRELQIGPLKTHTTSLVSGVLFIGIGLLFLLTEGTASLGGLTSTDTQMSMQSWLQETLSGLSNAVVLLVLVGIVLVVFLVRLFRSRSRSGSTAESSTTTDCSAETDTDGGADTEAGVEAEAGTEADSTRTGLGPEQ